MGERERGREGGREGGREREGGRYGGKVRERKRETEQRERERQREREGEREKERTVQYIKRQTNTFIPSSTYSIIKYVPVPGSCGPIIDDALKREVLG